MKFVKESIEDILTPKPKEEIEPLEKKLRDDVTHAFSWVREMIDMLESFKEKGQVDDEEWIGIWNNTHSRLQEAFYNLPEYIQPEFEEEFSELYTKLEDLQGHYIPGDYDPRDPANLPINEQKELNLSAGFAIIQDNEILLVHPTNAKWVGTYSIPKGHVESGEDLFEAAVRETREEIGYQVKEWDAENKPHFVDYIDKKGKLYKRVYYFIVRPSERIYPKDLKLQRAEVDWAGFLSKEHARKRIHNKLIKILDHLK